MKRLIREQRGFALIMVLILMLVGALLLGVALNYAATTLMLQGEYERQAMLERAADGGLEMAMWKLEREEGEDTPFTLNLNGCDVVVDIEQVMSEREFLGGISGEPAGLVWHAALPHMGESELQVVATAEDGIGTVTVTNFGNKQSRVIKGIVFWVMGRLDFVGNIENLGDEPEKITFGFGQSLVWMQLSDFLEPEEAINYVFEFTPVLGSQTCFAAVKQPADIWLVCTDDDTAWSFYRLVAEASTDGKTLRIESYVTLAGDRVRVLSYEFK